MEGVGARTGRSSTRYGPAAVFSGPVRKWKKTWVQSQPPSSLSSNRTKDASQHLLLYKWTPITPNSSDANAADNNQQPPPPPHRKFRYVPVSLIEEKEEAKEDEETNPNANQSPVENNSGDAIEGKPDTYDVPMEDSQASDQDRPAMHEPREGNLDLNLGWKAHNRDNIADHIMLDQNMGWTG